VSCPTWSRSSLCNSTCCVCWDPMSIDTMLSWCAEYYLLLSLCYLWSCMLSVASRYFGRVDASDFKREYLCSIVGFLLQVIWGSDRNLWGSRCVIATREKIIFLCPRIFALFTLCTLLNAIIYYLQLNTQCLLRWHSEGALLVIDAVGLRSIYFVVMPRVNLIVILVTCMLSLLYQWPNCNLFTQHVVIYLMERHH
jgi:hypothetical protein